MFYTMSVVLHLYELLCGSSLFLILIMPPLLHNTPIHPQYTRYDLTLNCFERAFALAGDDNMADVWYNVGQVAIGIGDLGLAYVQLKSDGTGDRGAWRREGVRRCPKVSEGAKSHRGEGYRWMSMCNHGVCVVHKMSLGGVTRATMNTQLLDHH